jgi:hypothetical protein
MSLPRNRFHNLRQCGCLGSSNQLQDLCALALCARLAALLSGGRLGRLLSCLGVPLRRGGLGFAALGGFLALWRGLLLGGTFFEEAFSGATVAPCSAAVAVVSVVVASAVFMVVNPFCASLAHDDSSLVARKGKAKGGPNGKNPHEANGWRWASAQDNRDARSSPRELWTESARAAPCFRAGDITVMIARTPFGADLRLPRDARAGGSG